MSTSSSSSTMRRSRFVLSELGRDADGVRFADMREIGANPARLIPCLARVHRCAPRLGKTDPGTRRARLGGSQRRRAGRVRAARGAAQPRVRRCRRASRCSVRTSSAALDDDVIAARTCSHTGIVECGARRPRRRLPRRRCRGRPVRRSAAGAARAGARRCPSRPHDLAAMRRFVAGARRARRASTRSAARTSCWPSTRSPPTASATAAGAARCASGRSAVSLICEVRDAGRLDDPLAGRRRPSRERLRRSRAVARQPGLRSRAAALVPAGQRRAAAHAHALSARYG